MRRRSAWQSRIQWCLYALLFLLIPTAFIAIATDAHNSPGPHGGVYLVHVGEPTTVDLEPLRDYYQQTLGLDVVVLPPISLDSAVFDPERRQLVAERVIASMRQTLSALADDQDARVLGVVEQDMYIERVNWSYAFSFREADQRFAVVSTARMMPPLDAAERPEGLVTARLRKMLTKNVGVMVYRIPASDDPTSIFFNAIGGVGDLDRIDDGFERLQAEFRRTPPRTPVEASYPCFIVSPLIEWDGRAPIDARVDRCTPGLRTERRYDELEVDLRVGLLVTRHTDFLRPDSMPLVLTRASHGWDTISRAFGIGGNHSYDILPVGSRFPYTFVDLVMPDGATIRYDRVSEGTDFANAVYEHHAKTAFLGSVLRWNGSGWDLRFREGGVFQFPENYSGTRSHEGAPSGMEDAAGHRIVFQRDRERRLMRLTSPSGRFLSFEYDNDYRVRRVTDDEGRVVRYEYDGGGRLASVDDGAHYTRYTYDGPLLSSILGNDAARLVQITYRDQRVAEISLADGRRVRFTPMLERSSDDATSVEILDEDGVATAVGLAGRR